MRFPFGTYDVTQKSMLAMQILYKRIKPKKIKKMLSKSFDSSKDRINYLGTLLIVGSNLLEDSMITAEPIYASDKELEEAYGPKLAKFIVYYRDKCKCDDVVKEYMLCLMSAHSMLHDKVLPTELMPDDMQLDEGLVYEIYYHPKRPAGYYDESPLKTFFIDHVLKYVI